MYPPAVAQAVGAQLQTARLPRAVVLCRRRRQHRLPLRQQAAGGGIRERVIGRQRQRRDAQHLPGVAQALNPGRDTVALPVALIVQLSSRQTPVALTQPPAPGLIAGGAGYRQRQRIHPQQRAAVVQRLRRQVQSPSFQPPGIGQRPRRRHRQRRQPGDRAGVGQWPAAHRHRVALPVTAVVDDSRPLQRQGARAVQLTRAGVVAAQRQRALRRQLSRIAQVCPGDRQPAPYRQRPPVVQPAQRQRCIAVRRQRAAVDKPARWRQRRRQRAVALYPPAVAQAVGRQLQAARLPLTVVDHRCRRQHRRARRQQAAGRRIGQRPVRRQRQRVHPQQRAAVGQRPRRQVQSLSCQQTGVGQRAGQGHRQRPYTGQAAAVVEPVALQRQPVALQRAVVRHRRAPDGPGARRQQRPVVVQRVQRQLPVAAQVHRARIAPPPAAQLQFLRR